MNETKPLNFALKAQRGRWRDVSVGQIGNLKVWRVPARKPVLLHASEQSPSIVCDNPMVFHKFGRLDPLEFSR